MYVKKKSNVKEGRQCQATPQDTRNRGSKDNKRERKGIKKTNINDKRLRGSMSPLECHQSPFEKEKKNKISSLALKILV